MDLHKLESILTQMERTQRATNDILRKLIDSQQRAYQGTVIMLVPTKWTEEEMVELREQVTGWFRQVDANE